MNYFINLHISKIRFFFYFKRKDIFVKVECFYAKKQSFNPVKIVNKKYQNKMQLDLLVIKIFKKYF